MKQGNITQYIVTYVHIFVEPLSCLKRIANFGTPSRADLHNARFLWHVINCVFVCVCVCVCIRARASI